MMWGVMSSDAGLKNRVRYLSFSVSLIGWLVDYIDIILITLLLAAKAVLRVYAQPWHTSVCIFRLQLE